MNWLLNPLTNKNLQGILFFVKMEKYMTTRFKVLCGVALLAIILLIGAAVTSNTVLASRFQKGPSVAPQPNTIGGSQTYPPGVPAIPISTSSGANANTVNSASTPAFTKNDVITFFNKHGFFAGPLVKGAHLKFLTIQFVTAKQASNLMNGESAGRPDTYLVCYVKVEGPFQVKYEEAPPTAKGTSNAVDTGDAVFDAHTGDLLVWGTY